MGKFRFGVFFLLLLGALLSLSANSWAQDRMQRRIEGLRQRGVARPPLSLPYLGAALKDVPASWGVKGALVDTVASDSPAFAAGLMAGDVITSVASQPVATSGEVVKIVSGLQIGQSYPIMGFRGKQPLSLNFTVGARPLQGAQTGEAPPQAKPRLTDFNVLKYALIDPKTRTVVLLGKYDPAYATGAIPYYDLLQDALRSPYASFSLEPTAATRKGVSDAQKVIQQSVNRLNSDPTYCNQWAEQFLSRLMNDPSLSEDRNRFARKMGEAFQLTPEEAIKIFQASQLSSAEMAPVMIKLLRVLGMDEVADAMDLMGQGRGAEAFERLGLTDEINALKDRYNAGQISKEQLLAQATASVYAIMLRHLNVPESEIQGKLTLLRNGGLSGADFEAYFSNRMTGVLSNTLGLKMFNGLVLSHAMVKSLYQVSPPPVELKFTDIPSDSVLGGIMYKADYTLKTIGTNPDIVAQVPEHLTSQEFIYQYLGQQGQRLPSGLEGEVRSCLTPGKVAMRVSPDGGVIAFGDTEVKVVSELLTSSGAGGAAPLLQQATAGYGDFLTEHYDQYAKTFPELQRFREAEKLVALARWAKRNNYQMVVDRAYGLRSANPATTEGFWAIRFTADQQEFSMTVIAEGGASFAQQYGEDWVETSPDVKVSGDALTQLAASAVFGEKAADAALAGDLEGARDWADKSARAMTGEIDFTQLPALATPWGVAPAEAAAFDVEATSSLDQSLRALDEVKVNLAKADAMAVSSPAEAAQIRQTATTQQNDLKQRIQTIRDIIAAGRQNPMQISSLTVTLRNPGQTIATGAPVIHPTGGGGGGTAPIPAAPTTVTDPKLKALSADVTPEQRKKWQAELSELEKAIAATQKAFQSLNKTIQMDQGQFKEWQEVAENGMDKTKDILFDLLMDASAGALLDRYETMYDLSKKLPDHPTSLMEKLKSVRDLLTELKDAKSFKDLTEWAARDGETLPEYIDRIRDGLTQIVGLTPLDKTPLGGAWKYGCSMVDMAYSAVQFSSAWDATEQLNKNSDSYLVAVNKLSKRMSDLMKQANDLRDKLKATQ